MFIDLVNINSIDVLAPERVCFGRESRHNGEDICAHFLSFLRVFAEKARLRDLAGDNQHKGNCNRTKGNKMGTPHRGERRPEWPVCSSCNLRVPEFTIIEQGRAIPCSEHHVRCIRCQWPVAKDHIAPDGRCVFCMDGLDRKRYYRRTDGSKLTQGQPFANYGKEIPSVLAKSEAKARLRREREIAACVGNMNEIVKETP